MDFDLDKIIKNINFKYVKPDEFPGSSLRYQINKYLFYLKTFTKKMELQHFTFYNNTETFSDKKEFDAFSKKMSQIEGMSTIANAWIINQIASKLSNEQTYVNIGCWKGFSLIAGMLNTKCKVFGVDNFAWQEEGKYDFYKKSSNITNFSDNSSNHSICC